MGKPRTGRALTNEIKYPYIVELPVALKELDAELSRQIIAFHTSRNIRAWHGRQIAKENKVLFSMVFFRFDNGRCVHQTVWWNNPQTLIAR
jgi:hypothetical protein